jgi:crossover junction endodeoxyribonuclease RuvC
LRILGIDPGTNVTGYGVIEREGAGLRHLAHGTLRPPRSQPMERRLAEIHAGLADLLASFSPDLVVIERIFVAANGPSALVLGQARGAALAAAGAAGVRVEELAPQAIKLAVTGNGAAHKVQVQAMVRRLLALALPPPRDAADALAAAICSAHRGRLAGLAPTLAMGRARRSRRRPASFVLRSAR